MHLYMQTCFTHSYIKIRITLSITLAFTLAAYCTFLKQTWVWFTGEHLETQHWHYPNESNSDFKQTWMCTQWCSTLIAWKESPVQLPFVLCGRKLTKLSFLPEFMHFNFGTLWDGSLYFFCCYNSFHFSEKLSMRCWNMDEGICS